MERDYKERPRVASPSASDAGRDPHQRSDHPSAVWDIEEIQLGTESLQDAVYCQFERRLDLGPLEGLTCACLPESHPVLNNTINPGDVNGGARWRDHEQNDATKNRRSEDEGARSSLTSPFKPSCCAFPKRYTLRSRSCPAPRAAR